MKLGTGGCIVGIIKTVTALSQLAMSLSMRAYISDEKEIIYAQPWWPTCPKRSDFSQKNIGFRGRGQNWHSRQTFWCFRWSSRPYWWALQYCHRGPSNKQNRRSKIGWKNMLDRLILNEPGEATWKYKYFMKKNKPLTLSSLCEIPKTSLGKDILVKTDISVLQRITIAYEEGRTIEHCHVMDNDPFSLPMSLCETTKILTECVECSMNVRVSQNASLDGQALVVSLDCPSHAKTFNGLLVCL